VTFSNADAKINQISLPANFLEKKYGVRWKICWSLVCE